MGQAISGPQKIMFWVSPPLRKGPQGEKSFYKILTRGHIAGELRYEG